nr:lamin tail domain-containing protein [Gemmatimonadaceae bacterium]
MRIRLGSATFVALMLGIVGACSEAITGPKVAAPDPIEATPLTLSSLSASGVVISQVYGGGGNTGSVYKNDFIELYNAGSSSVSLAGWSVQYASSAGTSWSATPLTGSIAPGFYYLVQEAVGSGGTTSLPAPNATGTIAMSATGGKVALVSNTTTLTGSPCPSPASIVDMVAYGTGSTCAEGSGPTPSPSNTNAAIRKSSGAQDTDNNAADFTAGAPTPRNNTNSSGVTPPPAQTVNSVVVTPATASVVAPSGTQQFSAKAFTSTNVEITGKTFTWTAAPASVATVSTTGLATGIAAGSATITATVDGVSGNASLTVTAPP